MDRADAGKCLHPLKSVQVIARPERSASRDCNHTVVPLEPVLEYEPDGPIQPGSYENDGLFDHVVPPAPPQSRAQGLSTVDTANEVFTGDAHFAAGPYGLGVRVPMIVISPWSKGGWVDSEVFDHTSLIRFIEKRFGVQEPNISPVAPCGGR